MLFYLYIQPNPLTLDYLKHHIEHIDPFYRRILSKQRLLHQTREMSFRVEDLLEMNTGASTSSSSAVLNEEQEEQASNEDDSPYSSKSISNSIFFSTGNPNVEIITGLIHLFRSTQSPTTQKVPLEHLSDLPDDRSTTICVLAVPSFLSTTDFCSFISCFSSKIQRIRILRDESPNRYMAVLDFCDQKSADSFYRQYNGKAFNSFDPEDCKLVFVAAIEFTNDFEQEIAEKVKNTDAVELPTCPVCLERLDSEVSGVITTMCNHEFHCECLTKWGDGTCPVCRYNDNDSDPVCGTCGCKANLWICLTCGHVGCGRYEQAHARDHYEETNHTYSMEIESQRVWDYVGDGYVHRLIANRTDGKLVEIPGNSKATDNDVLEAQYNSKLDSILMEYNDLLSKQLVSQRVYFENKLKEIEQEKEMQINNLLEELNSFRQERKKMTSQMEKSINSMKKQDKETEFLRQLNKTLINDQKSFKTKLELVQKQFEAKLEEKDKLIQELQEQNADLMMHFNTQQKIEKAVGKEDLEHASVLALNTSTAPKKTKKKKTRIK